MAHREAFETPNLSLASFLLTRGAALLGTRHDGPRVFFQFPPTAEALARAFFQPGQDTVPAREFHQNLRTLRGLTKERGW